MKKLIDCFTFYNELDILELRLLELYSVVDYFILVEAEETFSGKKKDLFFKENQERFRKYMSKIIHVKVSFPSNLNDPWSRESYQRNSFMSSLYSLGLSDKDIVMITDVDEIPNASRISYIKEHYDLQTLNKLEMVTYFGNFRNRQVYPKWYHPKVVNWGTLKSRTPEDCRLDFNCQWWEKSGWHLTYFGSPEMISNKIDSFSHQEYNKEEFKNIDYIKEKVSSGEDLFGEWRNYEKVDPETNPDLPRNWRTLSKIIKE